MSKKIYGVTVGTSMNPKKAKPDFENITNSPVNKGTGKNSAIQGQDVEASGTNAMAIGRETKATGGNGFAGGRLTEANGSHSFAMNYCSKANGIASVSMNRNTIASGENQLVHGKFNIEDTNNKYAHIVGNGTSGKSSNAYTLDWEGNGVFLGDVYVRGGKKIDTEQFFIATYNKTTHKEILDAYKSGKYIFMMFEKSFYSDVIVTEEMKGFDVSAGLTYTFISYKICDNTGRVSKIICSEKEGWENETYFLATKDYVTEQLENIHSKASELYVTWDVKTEGRNYVIFNNNKYVKVSDETPLLTDIGDGAYFSHFIYEGVTSINFNSMTITQGNGAYVLGEYMPDDAVRQEVIVAFTENASIGECVIEEPGIYFLYKSIDFWTAQFYVPSYHKPYGFSMTSDFVSIVTEILTNPIYLTETDKKAIRDALGITELIETLQTTE